MKNQIRLKEPARKFNMPYYISTVAFKSFDNDF